MVQCRRSRTPDPFLRSNIKRQGRACCAAQTALGGNILGSRLACAIALPLLRGEANHLRSGASGQAPAGVSGMKKGLAKASRAKSRRMRQRAVSTWKCRPVPRASWRTGAMTAEPPSPITTRFTRPIVTIADVETLERSPYDALVPARNLYRFVRGHGAVASGPACLERADAGCLGKRRGQPYASRAAGRDIARGKSVQVERRHTRQRNRCDSLPDPSANSCSTSGSPGCRRCKLDQLSSQ